MIGLLIISHGDMSKGLVHASSLITGSHPCVKYLGLQNTDSGTDFNKSIEISINELINDGADEVVLLIDLFGGTPFNQAMQLINKMEIKGITGVNLPMLLSALMSDRENTDVDTYIKNILDESKKGIINIDDFKI